jgi:phosphatidylinositol alpha-1,6-mannosyltransferase
MRILVLVTHAYGSYGGIAKYNRDLLEALCSYPETSEVVAIPRLLESGAGLLPAKLSYLTTGLNSKLKFTRTIWKAIRRNPSFDLVLIAHLNLLPLVNLVRLWVHTPALLVIHGCEAWSSRNRLFRYSLEKIDASASVSELTKNRFCAWSGFHPERVFLLPNSVDLNRFTPGPKNSELLERYGLIDRTVIMTLGRLEASERAKGFDQILEALPELSRQIPKISFLIAGDGTDRQRLALKAKTLNIDKQVVFAGPISEAEKVDHYRLADAYVMPSRAEGFGIVFLEALACGVPVMASKIDGGREAVHDGRWGVLVDPDNLDDIKSGIIEVLKRPRGSRPSGLDYYSYDNFERRIHHNISQVRQPLLQPRS